jgi:hypothetical protein
LCPTKKKWKCHTNPFFIWGSFNNGKKAYIYNTNMNYDDDDDDDDDGDADGDCW